MAKFLFFLGLTLTALPPLTAQAPPVPEAPLKAHLAMLADPLFEGRGPGQRGADLTVRYLETQLQALGLKPGFGTSYRQPVKVTGARCLAERSELRVQGEKATFALDFATDIALNSGRPEAESRFDDPVVFVGHGITAPGDQWDDYRDADVRGKIVLVMVNEPPPSAEEPHRFLGAAMSYFGRWIYKIEEAQRHGASGVLLIHTDASATYDWSVARNSSVGWRFYPTGDPGPALQSWVSEDAARRLCAAAGQDLDTLRQRAGGRDFRAVPLAARLTGILRKEVKAIDLYNVGALVEGADPTLKEQLVVYTAHWDHLGRSEDASTLGRIYPGAIDNASGCAGLLAMVQAAKAKPARRSQFFLFTAAEEQGLWGATTFLAHPPCPKDKLTAVLNLDCLNFVGATRDISLDGAERTTLGEMATKVAQRMGLTATPPEVDIWGGYYRADHFPFAKAGIPAFSVGWGGDYVKDPEASKKKAEAYGQRYHQTTDQVDPDWDFSGMVQQAQYTLNLGYAVANAPRRPVWKPGQQVQ